MSALIFIFVLGILVIVHEFGHFIVAKACGIRVEKFSIGFGPVIFGRQFGETEFCVSILPLGGFVKLSGESPEESKGADWEFSSKSLFQRSAVVLAGPLMNAFLAFLLFFIIFWVGQPTLSAKIGSVSDGTPAKTAGLLASDRVVAVNGEPVIYWEDVLRQVHQNKEEVVFRVERKDGMHEILVKPQIREGRGLFGKKSKSSFVGIAPAQEIIYVKSPIGKALWLAAERVGSMTGMIFASLGLMITGALPFKDSMAGPIGIFFMTQQAAQMGFLYLLYFMGSLSVSLFVLNLLPIPVLDGGHLLFVLIEHFKGSPLKDSVKERMTQGGLVLLLGLMAFVIIQDVHRYAIFENVTKFFTSR
jgi:regulator of sigma E protease